MTRESKSQTQRQRQKTDLAFALVHTAVTKFDAFHIALELLVALDLTFSLAAAAFLAHHLTALVSTQQQQQRLI